MKKWMTYSIALALTCALWGGQDAQAAGPVFVDENADGIDDNVRLSYHRGHRGVFGHRGTSSQLTEEQRAELETLVDGLKAAEASKEDIRAAVESKLEEWGIEFPERPVISSGLANLLSDDQQTVLTALIESLKATDTSWEDIRAAVNAQLEAWGIERPERGLDALLTEEQETALKALIDGLKATDTSRADIRAAVDAQLAEWGIERPERGLDALLTEEQEAELKTLIEGLKESDTSRADIRAAVDAKLEEWGVERPEHSRGGMRGHGGERGRHGHGQRSGFRGRGHLHGSTDSE